MIIAHWLHASDVATCKYTLSHLLINIALHINRSTIIRLRHAIVIKSEENRYHQDNKKVTK